MIFFGTARAKILGGGLSQEFVCLFTFILYIFALDVDNGHSINFGWALRVFWGFSPQPSLIEPMMISHTFLQKMAFFRCKKDDFLKAAFSAATRLFV